MAVYAGQSRYHPSPQNCPAIPQNPWHGLEPSALADGKTLGKTLTEAIREAIGEALRSALTTAAPL